MAVYSDVVIRGKGRPGDPEVRAAYQPGVDPRTDANAIHDAPILEKCVGGEIDALSPLYLSADLLIDEGPARRFVHGRRDLLAWHLWTL